MRMSFRHHLLSGLLVNNGKYSEATQIILMRGGSPRLSPRLARGWLKNDVGGLTVVSATFFGLRAQVRGKIG